MGLGFEGENQENPLRPVSDFRFLVQFLEFRDFKIANIDTIVFILDLDLLRFS